MTSHSHPASTLLLDRPAAIVGVDRSLSPAGRHRPGRRRPQPAAGGQNPPTVGRLLVTRLDAVSSAHAAAISSTAVQSIRAAGPASTVLHYRQDARHASRDARGYWAVTAEAVLGRPALSGRSSQPGGAPAAASTTGS